MAIPQALHDAFDMLASAFGEGWLLALIVLVLSLSKKIKSNSLSLLAEKLPATTLKKILK